MLISPSVTAAYIAAIFLTILIPAGIVVFFTLIRKIPAFPLMLGVFSFLFSQLVLRFPLLAYLDGQTWFQAFAAASPALYGIVLALTSGILEETVRFGGGALLRKDRTFNDVMSFGVGHALCEMVTVSGFSYMRNLFTIFLVSSAASSGTTEAMTAEQLESATQVLTSMSPLELVPGVLERFAVAMFQLLLTVIIFQAFIQKKWWLYPAAIGLHTVYNCISLLPLNVWVLEIILLVIGIGCLFLVKRSKGLFPKPKDPYDDSWSPELYP